MGHSVQMWSYTKRGDTYMTSALRGEGVSQYVTNTSDRLRESVTKRRGPKSRKFCGCHLSIAPNLPSSNVRSRIESRKACANTFSSALDTICRESEIGRRPKLREEAERLIRGRKKEGPPRLPCSSSAAAADVATLHLIAAY